MRLLPGLELIPSAPAPKRARTLRQVKGWRLTAAHGVGLGLLAVVMAVSLLQASPLHFAQRAWQAFETGPMGSFLIPPTPTPTPTPTPQPQPPVPPGSAQVVSIIDSVFGSYSNAAIAVARCESGLNPSAVNPTSIGGSHATGLFQILYPSTWDTTSQAGNSPYDAEANAKAAYQIFSRDGYNWHEWTCQP
ncbi:MAG TPA: transglycosylase SLT domain-containing protein [Ktedonobacterales bacterium]|nr:transglycosylase SLT domain-containing protein [Ktedonobacterales bacterium]